MTHKTRKPPITRTYKVVGPHPVDGHAPGSTFTARYSRGHEEYLLKAGHIALAESRKPDDSSSGSTSS